LHKFEAVLVDLFNPEPGTNVNSLGPTPAKVRAKLPDRRRSRPWALPSASSRPNAEYKSMRTVAGLAVGSGLNESSDQIPLAIFPETTDD